MKKVQHDTCEEIDIQGAKLILHQDGATILEIRMKPGWRLGKPENLKGIKRNRGILMQFVYSKEREIRDLYEVDAGGVDT